MDRSTKLYLTDIVFSEEIIIKVMHERSPYSAAGPDGFPSSLLVRCATELAPLYFKTFTHSLASGVVPPPPVLNVLQLFMYFSQVTGQSQVTTVLFH